MSKIKDPSSKTPRTDLSSAATHPFSRPKTADRFAAIRERLAAVAAELRQTALRGAQPDDDLLDIARKLEILATEEKDS